MAKTARINLGQSGTSGGDSAVWKPASAREPVGIVASEPQVALTATLRAPAREVVAFVNYHLNTGFRPIHLFFDDPQDPAAGLVEQAPGVVVHRCDRNHWARRLGEDRADETFTEDHLWANATRGFQLAGITGAQWSLLLDADELAYFGGESASTFMARIDPAVEVVRLPTLEGVPDALDCDFVFRDVTLFRAIGGTSLQPRRSRPVWLSRLQRKAQLRLARLLVGRGIITNKQYFCGHEVGKSLTRTSARIARIRSHKPEPQSEVRLRRVTAPFGALLHYDACSFEAWRDKMQRQMSGGVAWVRQGRHRLEQLEAFRAAQTLANPEALAVLYRREHMIALEIQPRLHRLGMLRRLTINPAMFTGPIPLPP